MVIAGGTDGYGGPMPQSSSSCFRLCKKLIRQREVDPRICVVNAILDHPHSFSFVFSFKMEYSISLIYILSLYSLLPHSSSFIFLLHPNNPGPHIFFYP
jgi:hypothetical protein